MHEFRDVVFDNLRARVVQPKDANGAGILQIPAWAGIGEGTDEYAQWMADEGFTVLTWDPFSAYPADISPDYRRQITWGNAGKSAAGYDYSALLEFTPDPFGDWATGRNDRLARAELASVGLRP